MNTNEMMNVGNGQRILPVSDVVEGWKWAGRTVKDVIDQDHVIINRQNEGFMNMLEDPETESERYYDASQHVREIREYKKLIIEKAVGSLVVVTLALCGVRTIKVIR